MKEDSKEKTQAAKPAPSLFHAIVKSKLQFNTLSNSGLNCLLALEMIQSSTERLPFR